MSETNTFSTRLKELRSSLSMTQVQFASYVGTNQVTLSAYETGSTNPSLEVVKEIAKKCNVSIDWLCGISDKKNLGNEIKDYPDLLRTLVSICSIKYENSQSPVVDASTRWTNGIHFIIDGDEIVNNFFAEWKKMYELLSSGTIDFELYNLWIAKELDKYKDHKINGIPF